MYVRMQDNIPQLISAISKLLAQLTKRRTWTVYCAIFSAQTSCTGGPKICTIFVGLYQMLTDFRNCFTVRIRRKFAIISSLKILPHSRELLHYLVKCHWVRQTVAAFHCSRHWSVASPAWIRRPAARWKHWTFDVKTAGWHDVTARPTFDNNWYSKHVVSCC